MKKEEFKNGRGGSGKHTFADYSELEDIRHDINSLRDNVVALTKHLKKDGKAQLSDAGSHVRESLEALRHKGEDTMETVTAQIRENPNRAVLIAFASGLLASILLRRD